MQEVSLEIAAGAATVTLDRPAALNAITPLMLDELNRSFDRIAREPQLRIAVLTGAGRAFSAGVDLKSLGVRSLAGGAVGGVLDVPGRTLIERIETLPKLVVAKVNGHCFTGALELVLACDLILVAEEAKLGDTHTKWGIRPSWGMSQRLPRRVGAIRARELAYTARSFTGTEAAAMGLANEAVPLSRLDAAVETLCERVLANSAGAIAAYKALFRRTEGMTLDEGLAHEAHAEFQIDDTNERLAAFLRR